MNKAAGEVEIFKCVIGPTWTQTSGHCIQDEPSKALHVVVDARMSESLWEDASELSFISLVQDNMFHANKDKLSGEDERLVEHSLDQTRAPSESETLLRTIVRAGGVRIPRNGSHVTQFSFAFLCDRLNKPDEVAGEISKPLSRPALTGILSRDDAALRIRLKFDRDQSCVLVSFSSRYTQAGSC